MCFPYHGGVRFLRVGPEVGAAWAYFGVVRYENVVARIEGAGSFSVEDGPESVKWKCFPNCSSRQAAPSI